MAVKLVSLKDFSGGYNTASEEATLPLNMSASMQNVDILDSKSIRRRNGYKVAVGSVSGAQSIEAELNATGDYYTIPDDTCSGGAYLALMNLPYAKDTATIAVPCSDRIRLYGVPSALNFVNASIQVDGGAWASITGTRTSPAWDSGVIAATSHTIAVKISASSTSRAFIDYLEHSSSGFVAATAIKELYRAYFADGTKEWLCIAGTALIRAGDDIASGRSEAESVMVAASSTGWSTYSAAACSGGLFTHPNSTVSTVGVVSKYAVPACDTLTARMFLTGICGPSTAASLRIDTGAWQSVTATLDTWFSRTYSGLTATTHSVYIKTSVAASHLGWDYVAVDYFDHSRSTVSQHLDSTISATATDFAFITYNDKVQYSTAYDNMRTYDGSVTATISASGSVAGGFATVLKNRAYVAGPSTDTALISYSGLDRPTVWNSSDSGAAHLPGKNTGQYCTGLKHFKNRIVWFSPSSIYALDPTGNLTDWVNVAIGENVGCVAPKSLVNTPNGLVFLSNGGVRMYGVQGDFTEEPGFTLLSDNITPSLTAYTDAQRVAAVGAYYRDRYWLAIGDEVYVYRFPESGLDGSWTLYRYEGITITCMHTTRADEPGLYAGTSDGRIVQLDTGTNDGGNDIEDYYVTPPVAPGGFETFKHFRPAVDIGVDAQTTQTVTVTPYTDDVSGVASTLTVTPNTAVQTLRAPLSARGRALKLKVSGSGSGQPRTLTSIGIRYLPPRIH